MRGLLLVMCIVSWTVVGRAEEPRIPGAALEPVALAPALSHPVEGRIRDALLIGVQGVLLVPLSAIAGWMVGAALTDPVALVTGNSPGSPVPFALSVASAGLSFVPLLWLTDAQRTPGDTEAWWLAGFHLPLAAVTILLSVLMVSDAPRAFENLVFGALMTGLVDAFVLGRALDRSLPRSPAFQNDAPINQ